MTTPLWDSTRPLGCGEGQGLSIRVMGEFALAVDGQPVEIKGELRLRLVLALLAAARLPASSADLADALWGQDVRREGWTNAVHAHVSRLRRVLDPRGERSATWLASRSSGYVLRPDRCDIDVLESSIAMSHDLASVNPRAALISLGEALGGYASPVFADFPQWREVVGRLEHRVLGAEDMWADLAAGYGTSDDADQIVALARAQPTREARWCLAMRALALRGRQVEALAMWREARQILNEEYGLEPGREMRLTHKAVLHQDRGLATPSPREDTRSLGFGSVSTPFLGRDEALGRLNGSFDHVRLLSVVGLGGVGKSRIVAEWLQRSGRAGASYWVDLRGTRPTHLEHHICDELSRGTNLTGESGVTGAVMAATRSLPAILVLDNTDDLVDDAARIAAELIGACPNLLVITTGRQSLGLTGERLIPLAPLELGPTSGGGLSPAVAMAFSRLGPGAPMELAESVASRAGGLPLAIEILAADPGQTTSLADSLPLLEIARHAVGGLPEDARRLFAALLSLPGGSSPGLTEILITDAASTPGRRARVLRELVAAALVIALPVRSPDGSLVTRHRILQPLLDMRDEFVGPQDTSRTMRRVRRWVHELCPDDVLGPPDAASFSAVLDDLGTVRLLMDWCYGSNAELLLETSLRLAGFWRWCGRAEEGDLWIRKALAAVDPGPPQRARALLELASGQGLGHMASHLPQLDEALSLLETSGDRSSHLWAAIQGGRAVGLCWQGDLPGYHRALTSARATSIREEHEYFHLQLDLAEALSWSVRGDPLRGVDAAAASARRLEELALPDAAGIAFYFAAILRRLGGAEPRELLDQGDRSARVAQPRVRALLAAERARHAIESGLHDNGEALEEAMYLTEQTGNLRTASVGHRDLGLLRARQGMNTAAEQHLRIAVSQLSRLDPGAAALAVAGLASLESEGAHTRLTEIAWALAESGIGTRPSLAERTQLFSLVGPPQPSSLEVHDAIDALRQLLE